MAREGDAFLTPLTDLLAHLPTDRLMMLLAQIEAGEPAAAEPTFVQRLLSNPLLLPIALFVIFYLTFIAPERRRKADEANLISKLAKNDRVITVGGLHGVIVSASADSDVLTLKIDEAGNTRVKVNRSAISSVVQSAAKKQANDDGK